MSHWTAVRQLQWRVFIAAVAFSAVVTAATTTFAVHQQCGNGVEEMLQYCQDAGGYLATMENWENFAMAVETVGLQRTSVYAIAAAVKSFPQFEWTDGPAAGTLFTDTCGDWGCPWVTPPSSGDIYVYLYFHSIESSWKLRAQSTIPAGPCLCAFTRDYRFPSMTYFRPLMYSELPNLQTAETACMHRGGVGIAAFRTHDYVESLWFVEGMPQLESYPIVGAERSSTDWFWRSTYDDLDNDRFYTSGGCQPGYVCPWIRTAPSGTTTRNVAAITWKETTFGMKDVGLSGIVRQNGALCAYSTKQPFSGANYRVLQDENLASVTVSNRQATYTQWISACDAMQGWPATITSQAIWDQIMELDGLSIDPDNRQRRRYFVGATKITGAEFTWKYGISGTDGPKFTKANGDCVNNSLPGCPFTANSGASMLAIEYTNSGHPHDRSFKYVDRTDTDKGDGVVCELPNVTAPGTLPKTEYEVFSTPGKNRDDASTFCEGKGGWLATFPDANSWKRGRAVITSAVPTPSTSVWIGGNCEATTGLWLWAHGPVKDTVNGAVAFRSTSNAAMSCLGFCDFNGQKVPNGAAGQECLMASSSNSWTWDQTSCGGTQDWILCEYPYSTNSKSMSHTSSMTLQRQSNQDGMGSSAVPGSYTPLGNLVTLTPFTGFPAGVTAGSDLFSVCIWDGTDIWALPWDSPAVVKVSTADGSMTKYDGWTSISGGSLFWGGAWDGTYVWASPFNAQYMARIASDGTITEYNGWPGDAGVGAGAFGGGAFAVNSGEFWLAPRNALAFVAVKTSDATMTSLLKNTLPNSIVPDDSLVFDGQYLWTTPKSTSGSVRINPLNKAMVGFTVLPTGWGNAEVIPGTFDGKYVWWGPKSEQGAVRLDVSTGNMDRFAVTFTMMGNPFSSMAFDGEALWLTPRDHTKLVRLTTDGTFEETTGVHDGGVNWSQVLKFVGVAFTGSTLWFAPFKATRFIAIGYKTASLESTASATFLLSGTVSTSRVSTVTTAFSGTASHLMSSSLRRSSSASFPSHSVTSSFSATDSKADSVTIPPDDTMLSRSASFLSHSLTRFSDSMGKGIRSSTQTPSPRNLFSVTSVPSESRTPVLTRTTSPTTLPSTCAVGGLSLQGEEVSVARVMLGSRRTWLNFTLDVRTIGGFAAGLDNQTYFAFVSDSSSWNAYTTLNAKKAIQSSWGTIYDVVTRPPNHLDIELGFIEGASEELKEAASLPFYSDSEIEVRLDLQTQSELLECTHRSTTVKSAVVLTAIPPPVPSGAREAIEVTSWASALVGGTVANPTAVMVPARMISLNKLLSCQVDQYGPIGRATNPLNWRFGRPRGAYYRGAIAGNGFLLLVLVGLVALPLLAMFDPRLPQKRLWGAMGNLHLPGILIVPMALFVGSSAEVATVLLVDGHDPLDPVVATMAYLTILAILVAGVLLSTRYLGATTVPREEEEKIPLRKDPPPMFPRLNAFCAALVRADVRWIDKPGHEGFKAHWMHVFADFKEGKTWYYGAEMGCTALVGVISGGAAHESCDTLLYVMLVVLLTHTASTIWFLPMVTNFDSIFHISTSAMTSLAALLGLIGNATNTASLLKGSVTMSLAVSFLSAVKVCIDIVSLLRAVYLKFVADLIAKRERQMQIVAGSRQVDLVARQEVFADEQQQGGGGDMEMRARVAELDRFLEGDAIGDDILGGPSVDDGAMANATEADSFLDELLAAPSDNFNDVEMSSPADADEALLDSVLNDAHEEEEDLGLDTESAVADLDEWENSGWVAEDDVDIPLLDQRQHFGRKSGQSLHMHDELEALLSSKHQQQ